MHIPVKKAKILVAEKSARFTHNRGFLRFLIFIVVCAYLGFALYRVYHGVIWGGKIISEYALYQELMKVPWWITLFYSSELGGVVSLILRSVAGFFALYSAVLFLSKGERALSLIRGKVGTALFFEASYYLFLIPSAVLGFVYPLTDGSLWYFDNTPALIVLMVNGVACLTMVMFIPPLLFKLRSKITLGFSGQEIIKWSCLTGISYLFVVFWLNYSLSWAATLVPYWRAPGPYGMEVLLDPINLISFTTTVFGVFLIAIFGLMSILPAVKKLPAELSLRRIGAVMTALGGYLFLMLLLYALSGGYAEHPTVWSEMIGPHNPDLWCVTFLFIGVPLLASQKIRRLE